MTGRVKSWNPKRLFGIVTGEDGIDYRVGPRDVAGGWLTVGQLLRFETAQDETERLAVKVECLARTQAGGAPHGR